MFEAFFLVGQEILYETSKYSVVVNSREWKTHRTKWGNNLHFNPKKVRIGTK